MSSPPSIVSADVASSSSSSSFSFIRQTQKKRKSAPLQLANNGELDYLNFGPSKTASGVVFNGNHYQYNNQHNGTPTTPTYNENYITLALDGKSPSYIPNPLLFSPSTPGIINQISTLHQRTPTLLQSSIPPSPYGGISAPNTSTKKGVKESDVSSRLMNSPTRDKKAEEKNVPTDDMNMNDENVDLNNSIPVAEAADLEAAAEGSEKGSSHVHGDWCNHRETNFTGFVVTVNSTRILENVTDIKDETSESKSEKITDLEAKLQLLYQHENVHTDQKSKLLGTNARYSGRSKTNNSDIY